MLRMLTSCTWMPRVLIYRYRYFMGSILRARLARVRAADMVDVYRTFYDSRRRRRRLLLFLPIIIAGKAGFCTQILLRYFVNAHRAAASTSIWAYVELGDAPWNTFTPCWVVCASAGLCTGKGWLYSAGVQENFWQTRNRRKFLWKKICASCTFTV